MELLEGKMTGTPDPETVSTKLQRIAQLAREDPKRAFLSLAHHIDIKWLQEAHARTRKDGATGVDRQTAADYAEDLELKLQSLLERFKSGRYKAPPVRRTFIPKGDGRSTRPIGIPTFEDKLLQRAVAMVLEAVYEQDFLDCSYGFRPGRSAHGALEALQQGLMEMGGGFVLEVDIKSYFDSLDHRQLRAILDLRVRDGVIRRAIDKWLAAGVWEAERVSRPETGTPQGGVISPLLANIYLHEVLDKWFETEVRPQLLGRAFLVRYADDFVLVLSNQADARRVLALLVERFGRYGLSLHPTKTRLLEFRPRRPGQGGEPGSRGFDFLGFNHHWDRTPKGSWVVQRKTASSRFRRTLTRLAQWCRDHRHRDLAWQHQRLVKALRGHDGYYGYVENWRALKRLRYEATRIWRKWLSRRKRGSPINWERFNRLLSRFPLPAPVFHRRGWRLAANPSH
jgi:group II intron reverse transcriptase/maturase